MQLYAYQDIYELLDESVMNLMHHLQKGQNYTEVQIKSIITTALGAEHADDLFTFLIDENLIIPSEKDPFLKYASAYSSHIVEKIYHESTRSYPFINMAERDSFTIDNQRMVEYMRMDNYPNLYKDYEGCIAKIALPDLIEFEDFTHIFNDVSRYDFLCRLGMLLGFCFGERKDRHQTSGVWDDGLYRFELLFKSVPSGGARHPTECYVVSDGEYLAQGCYHYSVCHHLLEKISMDSLASEGTFIVVTSLLERAMWRYRDPRSWRAIPCEIGHILKLLTVVSNAMGIDVNELMRGGTEELRSLLQIGDEEPIFGVMKVSNDEKQ